MEGARVLLDMSHVVGPAWCVLVSACACVLRLFMAVFRRHRQHDKIRSAICPGVDSMVRCLRINTSRLKNPCKAKKHDPMVLMTSDDEAAVKNGGK